MPKLKMYSSNDVADALGCSIATVTKYARDPDNEINFVGSGRRKIFIWFDEDIEKFKNRQVAPVGRPKKS